MDAGRGGFIGLLVALAALVAPAVALSGDRGGSDQAGEQSLEIWAYFDGDTPVAGGHVRVYADGRRLRERGDGPGPVTTFPEGMAMLRFNALPSALRIVVSGGRAGGERVRGSLKANVRGVTDGELVHVNPVTTVSDRLAHVEDGPGLRHARNLTERTLGIRRVLDDHDLNVTDRSFEGDRFLRWTLKQGSVEEGARALVQLIERPGFDRRPFRPGDGGGPEARASAGATAASVLNGLIDGVAGAAALTGPAGFAVSVAAIFFKQLISAGLEDDGDKGGGEDRVLAELRALSAQVTELEKHIDGKFLQLRVEATKKDVTDIEATQEQFRSMLKWAKQKDDEKQPAAVRKEARANLIERTSQFLDDAKRLVNGHVATHLSNALIAKQAGTKENPLEGPALMPAVREQIGKEHFFTAESSQRIRDFFQYYEWAQTNLATVLSEYYMLGGNCAVSFAASHPTDLLTSNDCGPVRGVAEEDLTAIKDNIARQRATLPSKVLDARVFIDRDNKTMWRTNATYRENPEILDNGVFCQTELVPDCQADLGLANAAVFPGFDYPTPWYIPKSFEYRQLFAGYGGPDEPLARLNSLGVRYKGDPLKGPAYFWLRGDFYLRKIKGVLPGQAWAHVDRIDSIVFKLMPGAKSLEQETWKLGSNCSTTAGARPKCQDWNIHRGEPGAPGVVGAYILWFRRMSDAEGAYWCRPDRVPSWDPAKC